MKRILLALIVLAGVARVAVAQQQPRTSGSITAGGSDCSVAARCVGLQLGGSAGTAAIVASGFGTATIVVELSVDATSLTTGAWTAQPETYNLASGATSSTFAANGYYVAPLKGSQWVRVRASSYTSGAIAVAIGASAAPPAFTPNVTQTTDVSDRTARAIGRAFLRNPGDTANMGDVTTPVRTDPTGTTTQPVAGLKTNNNAAPGATNIGVLPSVANASAPTWTEGNQVGLSVDLSGGLRLGPFTTTPTVNAAQSGAPWTFSGVKGNNAVAPGTSNLGVLPAIANASAPTWTEGNQVGLSTDLGGSLRTLLMNGGATGTNAASGTTNEAIVQPDATLTVTGTLQSAATANGNGTALTVLGEASAVITANCSSCGGGTTLNFEVSEDNSNFVSVSAAQLGTTTISTTTTTAGVTAWVVPVANVQKLRVRISGYSAGTVTVTAHASPVPWDAFITSVAQGPAAANTAPWPVRPGDSNGNGQPAADAPLRRQYTQDTDGVNSQAFDPTGSAMVRVANPSPIAVMTSTPFGKPSGLYGQLNQQLLLYGGAFGSFVTNFSSCQDDRLKMNISISQTASSVLRSGIAGRRFAICDALIVGADAENLSLVEGLGNTCGTGTVAVIGGTTAATGVNAAANSGYNKGNGSAAIALTNVQGNDLCLLQSGSGRVSGNMTIVPIP